MALVFSDRVNYRLKRESPGAKLHTEKPEIDSPTHVQGFLFGFGEWNDMNAYLVAAIS